MCLNEQNKNVQLQEKKSLKTVAAMSPKWVCSIAFGDARAEYVPTNSKRH